LNSNPLISIIIPVYNGQSYLAEAIKSILDQTIKEFQIIIVDDGSDDNSADIIKSFSGPIEYHYLTNGGTAAARNFGVQNSKGSFLAFLDQDDLWTENKLEIQLSAFSKNSELDVVFGHVQQFYSPETDEIFRQNNKCPSHPMPGYLPSAMLVKKDAFLNTGFFESAWQIGEWANWYVRAREKHLKMMMLPEVVTLRRIHAANKGVIQRRSLNEYVHILKASLDRRRSEKSEIQYEHE